jgi:hypothetical protein
VKTTFARKAKEMAASARSGQAMIETMLAVIVVTFLFLTLFKLSQMLTGKILLEHAAMRAARARAVGLNDFMCLKAARVAVIPAAGKWTWPQEPGFDQAMELARTAIYMATPNGAGARGVLDYEGWQSFRLEADRTGQARTRLSNEWFDLEGQAALEENFTLFMTDQGR